MKLTKIAAGVSASIALLSAGSFTSVVPQASVQAATKYQVRLSKKAYVYTSKGKKTKNSYKKNAKLTVYGTKTIKGKKYYNLGKGRYIRTSNAKKVSTAHSSSRTKKTASKKTTKKTSYAWSSSTKAFARSELLKMVNSYRSAAGVAPMKMDTNAKHVAYVDKVAAEYAKKYRNYQIKPSKNVNLNPNHNAMLKPFGIASVENVISANVLKTDSQKKQVTSFTNYIKFLLDDQKRNFSYKKSTSSNTSEYQRFIDSKLDTAVIGLGNCTIGNSTMTVMIFVFPY